MSSHGVVVCVAGYMYALVGFTLSVIAALFPVFTITRTKDEYQQVPSLHMQKARNLEKSAPRPRIIATTAAPTSDETSKSMVPLNKPPQHRSVTALPVITVIRPSTDMTRTYSNGTNHNIVLVPRNDSAEPTPPAASASKPCPGLRLMLNGKKPAMQRCLSSPQLNTNPTPLPTLHKKSLSDELTEFDSIEKTLRKTSSTPSSLYGRLLKPKSNPPQVQATEKKPPPTRRRTQPYEAPYFFPQPVPVIRNHARERVEGTLKDRES